MVHMNVTLSWGNNKLQQTPDERFCDAAVIRGIKKEIYAHMLVRNVQLQPKYTLSELNIRAAISAVMHRFY